MLIIVRAASDHTIKILYVIHSLKLLDTLIKTLWDYEIGRGDIMTLKMTGFKMSTYFCINVNTPLAVTN